ncbi:MAG: hypothetical protein RMJ56_03425 [Gemmataceae bacterium]|nr:hypothetical protein [Gemmata sp.]MDW8196640.1 hypothetical protein [Gemmataceae bacterium]
MWFLVHRRAEGFEEFDLVLFHHRAANADVADTAGIVEGTEANVTGGEGFVFGVHDRLFDIIEVDCDLTAIAAAFDAHGMPGVFLPHHAGGCLAGDILTRGLVDDEDVVRVHIRRDGQRNVGKLLGFCEAAVDAQVLMAIGLRGGLHLTIEDEIGELRVGDQGDMDGAAVRGRYELL